MAERSKPPSPPASAGPPDPSRRGFLESVGLGVAGLGLAASPSSPPGAQETPPLPEGAVARLGPGPVPLEMRLNGQEIRLTVEPATTLLTALRERLELTGTKEACGRGACGACTVLLDRRPVKACLMLALDARGRDVTTIEGLSQGVDLDPLQAAFIEHDALMCGFCTPGMILAAKGLLLENPSPSAGEIREALSGNLCRCGTYPHVFRAVGSVTAGEEG